MELIKITFLFVIIFLLYCIFFSKKTKEYFTNKKKIDSAKQDCCVRVAFFEAKIKGNEEYQKELRGKISQINDQNTNKILILQKKIAIYENKIKKIEQKMKETTSNLLKKQKNLIEKANYTASTIKLIRKSGNKLKEQGNTNSKKIKFK